LKSMFGGKGYLHFHAFVTGRRDSGKRKGLDFVRTNILAERDSQKRNERGGVNMMGEKKGEAPRRPLLSGKGGGGGGGKTALIHNTHEGSKRKDSRRKISALKNGNRT